MIIVIGTVIAKPDNISDIQNLSLTHVQRSQQEPGCIRHNVSIDCENPARFIFTEYWQDMAALKVHFGLQASQDFVRDLTPFVAAKPGMKIFEASEIEAG